MPRALCPALLILASLAGAEDGLVQVSDVRLALGIGPQPQQAEGHYTAVSAAPASVGRVDSTTFDSSPSLAATLGGVYGSLSPLGLLVGGEIRYFNGTQGISGINDLNGIRTHDQIAAVSGDSVPHLSYTDTGIAGLIGLGVAVSDSVHVEFLGLAGADWVTMQSLATRNGPKLTRIRGSGPGYTVGGRVGTYWTDPEAGWQFGLEGEYLFTRAEITTSFTDATIDSTIYNRGISVRGVLGHRF